MTDIDVLESVLAKEGRIVDTVRPDQLGGTTPCPEYDVRTLLNHIVGWTQAFAAGANERPFDGDAAAYTTEDHAGEFKIAAEDLVQGWRKGGTDRTVRFGSAEMPGEPVLSMTLMEAVTHACDLAIATGQDVPFSDSELETTLARAKATLPDEYRGEGKSFGHIVPVPDDAPAVDRLLGFMGRKPA